MYFEYGEKEIEYLKRKDKKRGEAIDRIGPIRRELDEDLFAAIVHQIIGQQISNAALETVWGRLLEKLSGRLTASGVLGLTEQELQSCGISFRKAEYIREFSEKVQSGALVLEDFSLMLDEEIISQLTACRGIGVWTAQMFLIFCLKRPNVVSWGDFGIRRGMRMLYQHRELDRAKFDRYAKRYAPYGTVASLYLWAIAGGALPELEDPAEQAKKAADRLAVKRKRI
ncbi:MAG: DNA-3-methyladenine glycosylase 2 family protein [Lachnospiraceae bacterium]|nr:DNA-3-methyladenine glycosylase 2 family protein [Lachnospiraceae bacterium]